MIAESAIDALSYAALHGHEQARFVSFSGGLSNRQPELLSRAMERMAAGSRVILAVDNDQAGDAYSTELRALFDGVGRSDLVLLEDRPSEAGADWNDVLRAAPSQPHGNRHPPTEPKP